MQQIITVIATVCVIAVMFYTVIQDEKVETQKDIDAVRQYPVCATARFPHECAELLNEANK